ncbi:MAG: YdaU family protein [Pseudomonadota bacterium]
MIWYKFNVGAYLAETLRLSDAEDLAYRRLIDLCYLSEQPLPLDKEAVARKIRMDLDVTESVLAEFFDRTEEGYRHARCEADIARYRRQVAINLENGRKGRHARSAD